jgi:hypothetical protein
MEPPHLEGLFKPITIEPYTAWVSTVHVVRTKNEPQSFVCLDVRTSQNSAPHKVNIPLVVKDEEWILSFQEWLVHVWDALSKVKEGEEVLNMPHLLHQVFKRALTST